MNIYDKATWQIEGGIPEEKVVAHFALVFEWLHQKSMLSSDGIDMLENGIDESISLNEEMVTDEGNMFLSEFYDEFISETNYCLEIEKEALDRYFEEFKR